MTKSSIALNRFGLGARPGAAAVEDGEDWLLRQMAAFAVRPAAIAAAPDSATVAADLAAYQQAQRAARAAAVPGGAGAGMTAGGAADAMAGAAPPARPPVDDATRAARQMARRQGRDDYGSAVAARAIVALTTETPFVERLVHFWANHFAVSADKLTVIGLAGTMEFEAIRPHVLGRFGDMLAAVERHPAMLLYLDQAVSVGPNSPLGTRVAARGVRKVGLNENLAREILELHTLGVRTGYTQADVTEFARAMTGWTVAGLGRGGGRDGGAPGRFRFAAGMHEPGDRAIVGKLYAAGGEDQAQAVLRDLAVNPATATHIATKLARHFAGDVPPPAMVARLRTAFLKSGGDLPTVYRALIASPEAWVETPVKFKTPWEWSISSMRALGLTSVQPGVIAGLMNQLGQPVWKPGQPVGYDDIAASWAGPDAVMRRVEAAERFATRAGTAIDARALANQLFPAAVSDATTQALARAESPGQALALVLVAPESMRR